MFNKRALVKVFIFLLSREILKKKAFRNDKLLRFLIIEKLVNVNSRNDENASEMNGRKSICVIIIFITLVIINLLFFN